MNKTGRATLCALSAVAVAIAALPPVKAAYDDFEHITSHVTTDVMRELRVARPSGDISTAETGYYLTGSSRPDVALTVNGEAVAGRGISGSWGVYVALSPGENVFTFKNGSAAQRVTLTRGGAATAATTSTLSKPTPLYDVAVYSGSPVTLSCIAPSGARITALVGGQKHALSPKAAAPDGVPTVYTAEFTMPNVSGTQEFGKITYSMVYGGQTSSLLSDGTLFAAEKNGTLYVEMADTSSTVFKEASLQSNFVACAKKGAVDYVQDIRGDMYQLGMGGWVQQSAARPLTGAAGYQNDVSAVSYAPGGGSERFTFSGTGKPIFSAEQSDQALSIRFAHTSGITSVPVGESELFSHVEISRDGDGTLLTFQLSGKRRLWGYVVEYDGQGDTILTCKYPPTLSSGGKPLQQVTVAIDPGHGGEDTGALGVGNGTGPMEKEINLNAAIAVKKRLEALGATVLLTREGDSNATLSDRMWTSQQQRADFFLSLHSNSLAENSNGLGPAGVEVYYYEDIAKPFASALAGGISEETGRALRGAKYANFKVTLATYGPAVLVEMGFLTHPAEYDDLCSRRGIFNTANAVASGIMACLS